MVYVISPAAHMSVIIVPASSIGESFVQDPAGQWSPLEPLLSCPDHIFCKGHGLPQHVMNIYLKGWNSDTAIGRKKACNLFCLHCSLKILKMARSSKEVLYVIKYL